MAKLYRIDDPDPGHGTMLVFHCPGCSYDHMVYVDRDRRPVWQWNGSMDAPTFSPSLLVQPHEPKLRCHLFIREGRLEFLADCHHDLAGKTVDMVELL